MQKNPKNLLQIRAETVRAQHHAQQGDGVHPTPLAKALSSAVNGFSVQGKFPQERKSFYSCFGLRASLPGVLSLPSSLLEHVGGNAFSHHKRLKIKSEN